MEKYVKVTKQDQNKLLHMQRNVPQLSQQVSHLAWSEVLWFETCSPCLINWVFKIIPVFDYDDKVVENLKVKNGEYETVDASDQGKKWEEYLKNLSPDDFGKYKV